MNNDLLEGRMLRKSKRDTIHKSSNALTRMEGFNGTGTGSVSEENAEDIADVAENSAALKNDIRKMKQADASVSSVLGNLGKMQQYGNKNVKGMTQAQEVPGYVTNAGIMKLFVDRQAFEDTRGKNNCPSDVDKLDAQGSSADGYGLFPVGSAMVTGQSCGNEGDFVQVTSFDDQQSSPDDIADSLGKLGYIDADATMHPINRDDYKMSDKFTTTSSSIQGSKMMPCDGNFMPMQDLGCWKDESNRAMWIGGEVAPMRTLGSVTGVASVEKCGSYCTENGANIFAVQDGKQCFCAPYSAEPADGEGYKTYGASTDCTTPCMGFDEETCGGTWANQVYNNTPDPPVCDIDLLQNTCTSNDDCIGFVVNPKKKTYQMFDTSMKGTDLATAHHNTTFYTRNATFANTDDSCTDDLVNRDMKANMFANYPVVTALDPNGSDQCGMQQYLQADLDNQGSATDAVNTQTNTIVSDNINLATTVDNVHEKSLLDNINASQNLSDFMGSTADTISTTKSLQNIVWNQEVGDMEVRKRQNLLKTVVWSGIAITVLGVAFTTTRKGKK